MLIVFIVKTKNILLQSTIFVKTKVIMDRNVQSYANVSYLHTVFLNEDEEGISFEISFVVNTLFS